MSSRDRARGVVSACIVWLSSEKIKQRCVNVNPLCGLFGFRGDCRRAADLETMVQKDQVQERVRNSDVPIIVNPRPKVNDCGLSHVTSSRVCATAEQNAQMRDSDSLIAGSAGRARQGSPPRCGGRSLPCAARAPCAMVLVGALDTEIVGLSPWHSSHVRRSAVPPSPAEHTPRPPRSMPPVCADTGRAAGPARGCQSL